MTNDDTISARVPHWLKEALDQAASTRSKFGHAVTTAMIIRETMWKEFAHLAPATGPAVTDEAPAVATG